MMFLTAKTRRFLPFFLFLGIGLGSFSIPQKATKWPTYIVEENLEIPVIAADDWSYPWYMIKHQDGHFENTTSDEVTAADTAKLIHNSACYSFLKKEGIKNTIANSRLPFAEATLQNDTLFLKIYDTSASNWESLSIPITGSQFQMTYQIAYVFPHEDIQFTFEQQHLTLNQNAPFHKGDLLKGKISTTFVEQVIYENGKRDQPRPKVIEGSFEVKIN